jgi:hypothetical protein
VYIYPEQSKNYIFMKKTLFAFIFLLASLNGMALTFPFSMYAFSVSTLNTVKTAPNQPNYVGIVNGKNNAVLAPMTYSGAGNPSFTNTTNGAYYGSYSSRCPTWCDITSLITNMSASMTTYANVKSDLSSFYTQNTTAYNCILMNNSFVGSVTANGSGVTNVVVMVWAANGATKPTQIMYFGMDSNNQIVTSSAYNDINGAAFQVAIP